MVIPLKYLNSYHTVTTMTYIQEPLYISTAFPSWIKGVAPSGTPRRALQSLVLLMLTCRSPLTLTQKA